MKAYLCQLKQCMPITQSEVSQREKVKYPMLTHMYGISKDDIDDPTSRATKETQM